MKNVDVKKLILLLVLIIIVVVAIVFVVGKNNKKKTQPVSEDVKEAVTSNSINYYLNLSSEYVSQYNGVDILFEKDKTEVSELSDAQLINAAIKYMSKNNQTSMDASLLKQIQIEKKIDVNSYRAYKGENVKNAIKELFNIDFENKSVLEEKDFTKTYWYLDEYDVYLVSGSPVYQNISNYDYFVIFKAIDTVQNGKDKVKTEVAVAYVHRDDKGYSTYSNVSDITNTIYEDNNSKIEIADDKVNEFTHYIINLKKVDNRYVFESIEKK